MNARTLSHEEAQLFYDRFGGRQDDQAFYEWPAVERMLANLDLGDAHGVVEFGCGTGKLAATLLAVHLSPECRYLGLDVSATMVGLARARIAPFGARAGIRHTDGTPRIEAPDGAFDRFVSTYVLDLLSPHEMGAVLDEAHGVLAPISSLNLLITSTVWRQDHNGFSHQDPGFLDVVVNRSPTVCRIFLPPDANTLLCIGDRCLRSVNDINVIVADK